MDGDEDDRVVPLLGGGDRLPQDEDDRLVQQLQQLVLVAVKILHHPGGAAEIVGDQVVGSDRRGAKGSRETARFHVRDEADLMVVKTLHLFRRLDHFLHGFANAGVGERNDAGQHAQVVQAGKVRKFVEPLERAGDAGQIFRQVIAGRIEQELVVLVRLHVFAVEVLIGLGIADPVARPLQLLKADRIERRAECALQHQRAVGVRFEFEDDAFADLFDFLVVVHELAIGDPAVFRQPECGEHGGRHAVGLLQGDAVHDALPARVIGGFRRRRLDVGLRRVHAATPIQFLHSDTASMALVPKASAPV